MTSSYRSISVGAAVVDVCDVLAESVVAEEEVLEVGADVVHLAVAVLARGRAAVRFLFRRDDKTLMNLRKIGSIRTQIITKPGRGPSMLRDG